MSAPNANFVTSKLSVKERWHKLYRNIYNMFLKDDFVHVKDIKKMLQEINTRLATIEANMAAGDAACMGALTASTAALTAMVASHFHIAPQAPAGAIPTGPAVPVPVAPPIPPAPAPTSPSVNYTEVALLQKGSALMSMGPATAPLGDGISQEALVANITSRSNVGV